MDVIVICEMGRGDSATRPNVRRYASVEAAKRGVLAGEVPGANLVQHADATEVVRGAQAVREWAAA